MKWQLEKRPTHGRHEKNAEKARIATEMYGGKLDEWIPKFEVLKMPQ
jgi:hypothetical protein